MNVKLSYVLLIMLFLAGLKLVTIQQRYIRSGRPPFSGQPAASTPGSTDRLAPINQW